MELNNGAEGGTASVAVSSGNSGGASGDAFNSTVGTPAITYDSTHALGTLAYRVAPTTSAQQMVWSSASLGTRGELWGRFYLWSAGAPSAANGLVRFLVGGSQTARLSYEAGGTLTFRDAGNSPEITSSGIIPTGQWVRIEWHAIFTPATGTTELRIYNNADSTTATETLSSGSANLGTNCDAVQLGSFNNVTQSAFWLDGLQVNDTGWPGPIAGLPRAPRMSSAAVVRAARW